MVGLPPAGCQRRHGKAAGGFVTADSRTSGSRATLLINQWPLSVFVVLIRLGNGDLNYVPNSHTSGCSVMEKE